MNRRDRWNTGRVPSRADMGGERGQVIIVVVLALGLFALGMLALAVDYTNAWSRKQSAQNAGDAACTAAAMDMLYGTGNFTPGTAFDCNSTSTSAPCQYAKFNGYDGSTGNTVKVSFPSTVAGIPACGSPPSKQVCDATGFADNAYVQVEVTDQVPLTFASLISGSTTANARTVSTCGLVLATSPVPLLVLKPTGSGTLSGNGNIDITVVGGPQRSIQVNSSDASAVSISGGSGSIDLSKGYDGSGSDFGVTGSESKVGIVNLGAKGTWVSPDAPLVDPYAKVPAPTIPATCSHPAATSVASPTYGCQDAGGCTVYFPGCYSSGIGVKKDSALFVPGVYIMKDDLSADSNSCLRPATPGTAPNDDGSGGTMFFFTGGATVSVAANAGRYGVCGTTTKVPLSTVRCISSGAGTTQLPASVVTNGGLGGNVLLGPCKGPTAGGYNYGDPLGTDDPLGEQRGMLFFQDRGFAASPGWSGGGAFGLSGIMYFHNTAFGDQFTLGGGSCSDTFVIGNIVTDQLDLHGNPCLELDLNPYALYYQLKASLLPSYQ